jgi:hypothetical protein
MMVKPYYDKDGITIYHVARREFCEDNKPTLDAFLEECFQDAND